MLRIAPTLNAYSCTPEHLLASRPYIDGLLAGAVVYRQNADIARGLETLIIRRAPSDSWPLKWEHPCGTVDIGRDQNMIEAAVRELAEETGLVAHTVIAAVVIRPIPAHGEQQFPDDENARMDEDGFLLLFDAIGKTWSKLTVLVVVEGQDVNLDPDEHDAYAWVTEDEVVERRRDHGEAIDFVSDGVRRTLLAGFDLLKAKAASSDM